MKKFHNHIAKAAYEYLMENAINDEPSLKGHFQFALVISGRGKTQGQIIPLQFKTQTNAALEEIQSTGHELWSLDHSTRRAFRQ